jgi:hypothetical protein
VFAAAPPRSGAVLLPVLPGRVSQADRAAPFVGYFTDPLIEPVARTLRLPARAVAFAVLVAVAVLSVTLTRTTG